MFGDATMDTFARDSMPPRELMPDFVFTLPGMDYPARLNAAAHFVDRRVAAGDGARTAIIGDREALTYAELQKRVDAIAHALTQDLGVGRGNRVLVYSPNNPFAAAAILAVMKCGAIAVPAMALLRAGELAHPLDKAKVAVALCDARLLPELEKAQSLAPGLARIAHFGVGGPGSLEAAMARHTAPFAAAGTAVDDVCLIAFTSGTTGKPKGTMHFHRDLVATCDTYGAHVLKPSRDDIFIGTPPLAFTFGFGGHVLFPFSVGATTVILERLGPDEMLAAIAKHRATIVFTAPTAYRAMLPKLAGHDVSSLRKCVSAGETLPASTYEAWKSATGLAMMDGIGSTEMLHIFIASPQGEMVAGSTGRVVPGYEAKVIDAAGRECPDGTPGRLAVRGPTGCRYLADERQKAYVEKGWNITGDTYIRDAKGYFWYQARSDDMIVSAGYNISGPEVEACLMTHPDVEECGVVAAPDAERGNVVKAYVALHSGAARDAAQVKALQDHVKAAIAPYKYPRAIEFVDKLPRTPTGKLQRAELRKMAAGAAPTPPSLSARRTLLPEGWPVPRGYANAMAAEGRQVFVGGQIGWDEKGVFADGFAAQVAQALRNIAACLHAAGAGPEHIVRLTWYVTDMEAYRSSLKPVGAAYREIIGAHFPAMALVQVAGLVEPQALVEIEATAVV